MVAIRILFIFIVDIPLSYFFAFTSNTIEACESLQKFFIFKESCISSMIIYIDAALNSKKGIPFEIPVYDMCLINQSP